MAAAKKKIHLAYERAEPARKVLEDNNARCMEVTEDTCGILWERWLLPSGECAVVFATPDWCEVFVPLTDNAEIRQHRYLEFCFRSGIWGLVAD